MQEIKPFNPQEEKISREYHLLTDEILELKKKFMGYPVNEESGLESFYKTKP